MIKYKFFILIVLLFFINLVAPTSKTEQYLPQPTEIEEIHPPLTPEEISTLDSIINKVLNRYRYNGNVLVAYQGYPVYTQSRGFKDLNTKDSLNLQTAFQIASVSKGFTAAAILILQQRNQLHINDAVIQHIPDFPFPEVTIKHLLQHTSGLQNYMYYVDKYWPTDSSLTNKQVLDLLKKHNPQLNFRPGSRHHYNNTGYAMLALVVEHVSGKPFHQFAKEEIFLPLGMTNTFVWNKEDFYNSTNITTGFAPAGRRYRKQTHNPLDEVSGDKSVYSTVEDLLKWDQALYTDKLLSDSLLTESFQKTRLSRGREFNYGYGWRLNEIDDKKVIYHNGLWNGFTSSLTRYIDDHLTIILVNNINAPVATILREIYAAIKPELEKHEEIPMALENVNQPIAQTK